MSLLKSIKKAVKQVAPIATTAGMAYLTGGTSLAAGGVGSSLLSSLGSGEGVLGSLGSFLGSTGSNLLSGVVEGAVGLGQDYLTAQQQLSQNQQIANINLAQNQALAEQQFAYNKQMADDAYQKNVAMWNMQNAYNSPTQQMARLKSAGLNPNLVYGGGSVTGNTASSAPSYNPPEFQRAEYQLGMIDSYQKIENQAIQNKLMAQQTWNAHVDNYRRTAKNNADVNLIRAKQENVEKMNKLLDLDIENYEYNKYLSPILQLFGGMIPKGSYKIGGRR